ncbi:MAG: hypothetical protein RMX35_20055 [Nostoc sp. DcaGUA01]|nr:hypothetical protein [Nostoc sp. DedQUE11]MDZ8075481.1 hypothetical protein [Nostoc sp. DedQUE01]MDZ8081345.1 hypothetical protein [Nostoc sp. DcaGUA01]
MQIAKTLGQQVVIGGLSTGGTLAAWLALEHPQEIDSTLLFNPYLLERGVREAREEALAMGQSESVGNNGNQIQGEEVKIGHRHPLL